MSTERRSKRPYKKSGRYNMDRIEGMVDIVTVAEHLGLDIQQKGKLPSILCPCHEDKHFGSCFLKNNRFNCYSCHAHGDAVELVIAVKKITFREACEYVCSIYGEATDFQNIGEKPKKKGLDEDDLELIGLSKGDRVYSDVGFFDFEIDAQEVVDRAENKRQMKVEWTPFGDEEFEKGAKTYGTYRVMRLQCADPLQELLEENEDAYWFMISEKARESAQKYQDMIDMALRPEKYYDASNIDRFIFAYECYQNSLSVTFEVWKDMLEANIKRCEEILKKHAHSLPNPPEPTQKTKIFGKIKGNGVSL